MQHKRNGKGIYYIKINGEKYKGDFVEDKRHGDGIYTYSKRVEVKNYIGEFRNELKHGHGTLNFRDGSAYIGEFKNGKFNGYGFFATMNTNKKVTTEYGIWEDGILIKKIKISKTP